MIRHALLITGIIVLAAAAAWSADNGHTRPGSGGIASAGNQPKSTHANAMAGTGTHTVTARLVRLRRPHTGCARMSG